MIAENISAAFDEVSQRNTFFLLQMAAILMDKVAVVQEKTQRRAKLTLYQDIIRLS